MAIPPRFDVLAVRDVVAGVENLVEALEDVGGLSTNDVSVVLLRHGVSWPSIVAEWMVVHKSCFPVNVTIEPLQICGSSKLLLVSSSTAKGVGNWSLWEVDTESVHVQAVHEAGEVLAEPRQTLVHKLQVHEVSL